MKRALLARAAGGGRLPKHSAFQALIPYHRRGRAGDTAQRFTGFAPHRRQAPPRRRRERVGAGGVTATAVGPHSPRPRCGPALPGKVGAELPKAGLRLRMRFHRIFTKAVQRHFSASTSPADGRGTRKLSTKPPVTLTPRAAASAILGPLQEDRAGTRTTEVGPWTPRPPWWAPGPPSPGDCCPIWGPPEFRRGGGTPTDPLPHRGPVRSHHTGWRPGGPRLTDWEEDKKDGKASSRACSR